MEAASSQPEMEQPGQASQELKRKGRQNIRKRKAPDEAGDDQDPTAAIKAAAAAAAKRRGASKGGTTFGGRSADDDSKLQTFKFESSNTIQQAGDQGATAILETETQHDRDARWALLAGAVDVLKTGIVCWQEPVTLTPGARRHTPPPDCSARTVPCPCSAVLHEADLLQVPLGYH